MNIYRTTQGSMSRLLTSTAGRLNSEIRRVETQAITGLKFSRPSDAPAEVASALKLRGLIQDQAEYEGNITRSLSFHARADDALAQAGELFKRAKEIAVAGASESYDGTSRAAMAVEVAALVESLSAVANTRIGERYLFSGTAYDEPAFDAAFAYQGNTDTPETQITLSTWTRTGMDGSEVFQGSVDAFGALQDVEAALLADDPATVSALLSDLDDAFNHLTSWRQRVGNEERMTLDAEETAGSVSAILTGEFNNLVQIDEAETYTRLSELQQSYNAAMTVGAASASGRLFDLI
ncbi:MAG: flagellar hook-associated protein 3 FlgL [Cognaticolwellia sp.]|jgi:flagellar hook-associated protein 3 FlgL